MRKYQTTILPQAFSRFDMSIQTEDKAWNLFQAKRNSFFKKINTSVPDEIHATQEFLSACKSTWMFYVFAKMRDFYGHALFEVDEQRDIMNHQTSCEVLWYFEQLLGRSKTRELIVLTASQILFGVCDCVKAVQLRMDMRTFENVERNKFCKEVTRCLQTHCGNLKLYCILRGQHQCYVIFRTNMVMQDFIFRMMENCKPFQVKIDKLGYTALFGVNSGTEKIMFGAITQREDLCEFPSAAGYKPGVGNILFKDYLWFANESGRGTIV